jgi:A/G-specific adenine glycosylase
MPVRSQPALPDATLPTKRRSTAPSKPRQPASSPRPRAARSKAQAPSAHTTPPVEQKTTEFALPPEAVRRSVAQHLLAYYRTTARKLPWRDSPTGYGVWVSEMMLQQTQVATVLPYYQRWMSRFPTLESLANATEADVLALWQGLGYYARARALHAGAQYVLRTRDGQLPRSASELRALPGIGPYTAGAIASIAFEEPAPIVDGNVIRVLCRVFGLSGSPMHQPLKSFLWQLAEALIPRNDARDFNQALMEFGAMCCTPKNPLCRECPLRKQCFAHANNAVERLPELPERPKTTQVVNVAALVRRGNQVLVGQLPANASRWASMWQFPNVNLDPQESESDGLRRALDTWFQTAGTIGARLHSLQHSVTRYRITVHLYEVTLQDEPRPGACQAVAWGDLNHLTQLAMPAAHRKLASRVLTG